MQDYYRIRYAKRNCLTPHQRLKRAMKQVKRYPNRLRYLQSLITRNREFVSGLAKFLGYTFSNKQTESFTLRFVTWFRLKILFFKFLFTNSANQTKYNYGK